jgi:hypothetical protein
MDELRKERERPQAPESDLRDPLLHRARSLRWGRRQRLAQGWDGDANPVQAAGRLGGVLQFRPPGAKGGSGCYSVLEAKGL